MTLQVKFFTNSLPGAPALTGQVGSLISLLDAVLVNGFNTKTISSITSAAGVATVTTSTAHGYTVGSTTPIVLDISGADQTAYNGTFSVTITGASTFTYPVSGSPASPATTSSSMSCKVSPLGWTKPFSGTNIASYKMPAGSSGLYLGVDDNQASGSQYWARVRMFETMSAAGVAVASGTGPIPTDGQLSGGKYQYKSTTQDATARPWRIVGDAYGFYLHVLANGATNSSFPSWYGDQISYKAADAYPTTIAAQNNGSAGLSSTQFALRALSPSSFYIARSYTQIGSAVAAAYSTEGSLGTAGFPYPNGPDSGLYLSKVRITESGNARGVFPGLYSCIHNMPGSDGDLVSSVVEIPGGLVLLLALCTNGGTENGRIGINIVGPWR